MWQDYKVYKPDRFIIAALKICPINSIIGIEGHINKDFRNILKQYKTKHPSIKKGTFLPFTSIAVYKITDESRDLLITFFGNNLFTIKLSHTHIFTPRGRMFEGYHIFDYPSATVFIDSEMPERLIKELENDNIIENAES